MQQTTPVREVAGGQSAGLPEIGLILNHLTLIESQLQAVQRTIDELQPKGQAALPEGLWLKPADAAALLNVPVRTLQSYVRQNRVPEDAIRTVHRAKRVDRLFHREKLLAARDSGVLYGVSPAA